MMKNNQFTNLGALVMLLFLLACGTDDEVITVDLDRDLPGSITLKNIPAGSFTMGGRTNANDAPEVTISFSAFQMSEKEITNAEYISFLNAAYADEWITVAELSTTDPCGT